METAIIRDGDLSYAADVILSGGLVAVPTDTIYGLAGNGLDSAAVESIYEVKGRPSEKPLILLIPDMDAAVKLCSDIPEDARLLAKVFWPGALTLILPRSNIVPDIVTAGANAVGVRCPNHPKTLDLLRLAGVPLAAPSANPSDMPSPKTAGEVLAYFDGKIPCVVDGGTCTLSFESTIIDLTAKPYKIIRQGAIPEMEIWQVLRKR